ncbi:Hemolysin secretion protein D, chromosomal [bacterium HR39]|nr:Hemolysin secretion protein D, chromosomal [bacterium HR39]
MEALRELAAGGLYPRVELLARERELAAAEGRLQQARSGLRALRAALAEAESRLHAFDADTRSRLRAELEGRRGELRAVEEELRALEARRDGLLVRAPVAGFVRDLRLRAPGQALPAHAPALEIVPEGEELVVRVAVANEDIGDLRPGSEAVLKVRAFEWTRFGTLRGRVRRIDADAETVRPDRPPVFVAVVEIDRADPAFARWEGRLQPGMVVDVEFRTGRRSLLDYLLARLRDSAGRAFSEG